MQNTVTEATCFFGNHTPMELTQKYGSPLYVYNEKILKQRCYDLVNMVTYPNWQVTYSVKANSNLELLKIIHSTGMHADAMSPGEITVNMMAGFTPAQNLYISNNVSREEMKFAIDAGVMVSVDSVSQLRMFGELNPGGSVCIRFNPGVGAGHHEKVITGGKKTKFGVDTDLIPEVKQILSEYSLRLAGINQHIGSLFMEPDSYFEGIKSAMAIAENFEDLDFIDFGGGFGIPYHKLDGEPRLDLAAMGEKLDEMLYAFAEKYGKQIMFKAEPGRYAVAEASVLLGTVHAVKTNYDHKYAGTDIGFNVLIRPAMYESHHDIEVYREGGISDVPTEPVTVVGNICETGDILAKDRVLPVLKEGDVLGILDAGAYGYSMCSNYNNRLRPAEVLICEDGNARLIRRRDTIEDLMRNFEI